jgi:hypothetical protein
MAGPLRHVPERHLQDRLRHSCESRSRAVGNAPTAARPMTTVMSVVPARHWRLASSSTADVSLSVLGGSRCAYEVFVRHSANLGTVAENASLVTKITGYYTKGGNKVESMRRTYESRRNEPLHKSQVIQVIPWSSKT